MKLRYTTKAAYELENILDYIAKESPQGADRVQRRLQEAIGGLLFFPSAGQRTRRKMRRVVVTPFPYVVFYEATEEEIVIVRIRHTARRPGR